MDVKSAQIEKYQAKKKSKSYFLRDLKAGDFLLALLAVIVSLSLWGYIFTQKKGGARADIMVGSDLVASLDLDSGLLLEDLSEDSALVDAFTYHSFDGGSFILLSSSGIDMKIECKEGRVGFVESNCPDKVCVQTGFIHFNGQLSVCIPARTLIKIEGEVTDDSPDFIIG